MLTWVSPMWLWALAGAVGLPVAAHVLSKLGGWEAEFPAVRFLQQAVDEGRRRLRVTDWWLLLLRVLVLALVACAFAQPRWYAQAPLATGRGLAVVLLVDRSASMQVVRDGATLFDRARRAGADLLDTLDPTQDRAAVVFVDGSGQSVLPTLTGNLDSLRAGLLAGQATFEAGRLDAALQTAVRLIQQDRTAAQGGPARQARIVLLSDMQATQAPSAAMLSDLAQRQIDFAVQRVEGPRGNLALTAMQVQPRDVVVGQPVSVTVEVSNFSDADQPVRVELETGGKSQTRDVVARAGGSALASFELTPRSDGPWVLVSRMAAADAWPTDNELGAVVPVHRARRVTLVTASDTVDATTAAFYVMRALLPDAAIELGQQTGDGIDLQLVGPERVTSVLRDGEGSATAGLVVLVEAGLIDRDARAVLRAHLERGGGVLWMVDSPEAADALTQFDAEADGPVLSPVVVDEAQPWRSRADAMAVTGRFTHELLDVFDGAARSVLLDVRYSRALASVARPTAEPLLTEADGRPLLSLHWAGAGRLAVFGADLSPAASDLVKGPAFAPLLHQFVRQLAPGPMLPPSPMVGAAIQRRVDPPRPAAALQWRLPNGETILLLAAPGGPIDRATLDTTQQPGLHRLENVADDALVHGAWVRIDPAESDLRPADDAAAVAGSDAGDDGAGGTGAGATEAAAGRPVGTPLWPYLLLAAAALLLTEQAVLLWAHRGQGGDGSNPLRGVLRHG